MGTAQILKDINMSGWPPKTWLIHLSEPLVRYDPVTGQPDAYDYIALSLNGSQTFAFPSTEQGAFVDMTMTPMRNLGAFEFPHDALAELGYTVA